MTALLLALLAAQVQEDTLEALFRRLGSDALVERQEAVRELRERGREAVEALGKAELARDPKTSEATLQALEEILGYRPVTAAGLRSRRITWATAARDLAAALADLEKQAGIPLGLEAPDGVKPAVAALRFEGRPLDAVLDAVAEAAGAIWVPEERRIRFIVATGRPLRLYDVRDVTSAVWPERRLSLEPGELYPAEPEQIEPFHSLSVEDVANLVKNELFPMRWEEAEGRSLQALNGFLVVRNDADIQQAVGPYLDTLRRRHLVEVRAELRVVALPEGAAWEPGTPLPDGASVVASPERVVRERRPVTFRSLAKATLVDGYGPDVAPSLRDCWTGMKVNAAFQLSQDRGSVSVELEGAWSRLVGVTAVKGPDGERQAPEIASHVLRAASRVPAERWVPLGRLSGTRLVEGKPELVVAGRFSPVSRR